MKHLIIKNLGPINAIEMEMKRVNLIIGPQSSGKSSVLKVACYCTWVEKRISVEQNPDKFAEPGYFERYLVSFHKLEGFVRQDTYIEYESDIMKFSFSKESEAFRFEWKNRWDYRKSKISYIPAERNIVAAIPNWFEVNMANNNIRNFMADWELARKNFTDSDRLDILNLGVSYFYDTKSKEDKMQVAQGKFLNFTNTSSGLQSLVPLYVFLKYFTERFFLKEEEEGNVIGEEIKKHLAEVISSEVFSGSKSKEDADKFSALFSNFTKVNNCNIFLEEPEENLFPLTQRDLVNALVEMINGERKHNLFITTHSPYVMASFNNLIQAGDVLDEDRTKQEKLARIMPLSLVLNYEDVGAYAIKDGNLHTMMDDEMKLISPTELDAVSDEISIQFGKLLEL
ncbi:AAA family ATPase [Bacteroidaceae bacterium]|jgi:hypothetical protein|nr:ATP-binding protein [Bacteroides sp.]